MLGAVRIFQPVHGYFVRRELLTWRADQWASVNPGSVYNALRALARDGFLEEVGTEAASGPARTSYRLTDDGEGEFFQLLREALWSVEANDPGRLMTAVSFMRSLSREEVLAALEHRVAEIEASHRSLEFSISGVLDHPGKPRHVAELFYLNDARLQGELRWTHALAERLREGGYSFAGEPESNGLPEQPLDASRQV
jgi:DNA-binding PadR family transcriptional regulator